MPNETGRRIDGRLKVTGQMKFTLDLAEADALFAVAVRSPYPHARILSIDATAAARLPGVHAVLCGTDVARVRTGRGMRDVPVLAVDKVRWIGEIVRFYTNEVSNGSMRAPGAMQVVFAVEAMMDLVARELELDPFEFRRRNLLHSGEVGMTGTVWPERRGREVLDAAERASTSVPERPPAGNVRIGRGVAVCDRPTHAPMHTSLRLRVRPDGLVEAHTPIPETGTGAHTVAQRVLARELGIVPERIRVVYVGTDELPFDFGVGGQMVTGTLANVCVQAATRLTAELEQRGIDLRAPSAAYPLVEIMAETADQSLHEGGVSTYCAQVAQVAVDLDTGAVRVLEFVSAHDVAEIIDPVSHRGQIEGGFAMGLGFALSEDLALEDGRVGASHLGTWATTNCRVNAICRRCASCSSTADRAFRRGIPRRLGKCRTSAWRQRSSTPSPMRSACRWTRCR